LDNFVKDTYNFVSGLMREGKFGSLASFGFSVGMWGLTMCQMWVGFLSFCGWKKKTK
jgi:hypothetical protein